MLYWEKDRRSFSEKMKEYSMNCTINWERSVVLKKCMFHGLKRAFWANVLEVLLFPRLLIGWLVVEVPLLSVTLSWLRFWIRSISMSPAAVHYICSFCPFMLFCSLLSPAFHFSHFFLFLLVAFLSFFSFIKRFSIKINKTHRKKVIFLSFLLYLTI